MKKYVAFFLVFALVLALAACSSVTTPSESAAPGQSAAASDQQTTANDEAPSQDVQDIPFGPYHTEEELLAMLEKGDFADYLSVDPETSADPVDTGGDEPYSGFSNAITYTDGGDTGGVEFTDFMDNLDPDIRTELEELENIANDPEIMEAFEGAEEMAEGE